MTPEIQASFSLDRRVAVITGAASGIGRETARTLAEAGARVVLCDINEAGLRETAALVAATGQDATVIRTDVGKKADIDAAAEQVVAQHGGIDIWVNCAARIVYRRILDAREEDVDSLLSINLKGVYWSCAAAGRAMKATGGGSIINISSAGGELPAPDISIYSMTKAGVNMITRTAATEMGCFGIRVNAVAPGWVDTPMGLTRFTDDSGKVSAERREEALQSRAQGSPLGTTGTPRDIALAVLYLVSDAARFVTGQILRPNGGIMMP